MYHLAIGEERCQKWLNGDLPRPVTWLQSWATYQHLSAVDQFDTGVTRSFACKRPPARLQNIGKPHESQHQTSGGGVEFSNAANQLTFIVKVKIARRLAGIDIFGKTQWASL